MSKAHTAQTAKKAFSEAYKSFSPIRKPVAPFTIHGTFTAYDRTGNKVVRFSHETGGTFATWEEAQDAVDAAEARKPWHVTHGGFVSYYLVDATGNFIALRRDGWLLREDGIPYFSWKDANIGDDDIAF